MIICQEAVAFQGKGSTACALVFPKGPLFTAYVAVGQIGLNIQGMPIIPQSKFLKNARGFVLMKVRELGGVDTGVFQVKGRRGSDG